MHSQRPLPFGGARGISRSGRFTLRREIRSKGASDPGRRSGIGARLPLRDEAECPFDGRAEDLAVTNHRL